MNALSPITLDPTQLEEKAVQQAMGWMNGKSTDDLQDILNQATIEPQSYAPEIIEAVQRI